MDLFEDVISARRSIRSFKDEPIENDLLLKLVKAGVWAPTGGNAQTWDFIIVRERKMIEKIQTISPGILGTPVALIVICQDLKSSQRKGGDLGVETLSKMDTAMAAQNIMLQAHVEGIGSCPIASFHKKGVKKLLNIPERISPQLIVTLGYPNQDPIAPKREFESKYFFEKYGRDE